MSKEKDYKPPVSQLLTLGACEPAGPWLDYASAGLDTSHVPELIRMALDRRLNRAETDSLEVWAPLHALRALGQMRAADAIVPLMKLMGMLDRDEDDWFADDLPKVYGMLGPAAIQPLAAHLADGHYGQLSRGVAAASLTRIARMHPPSREQCIAILVRQLEHFRHNPKGLNRELVEWLLELEASEAEPLIERAIAARRVEDYTREDWEETLAQMHPPPPEPQLSPQPLWRRIMEKLRLMSRSG